MNLRFELFGSGIRKRRGRGVAPEKRRRDAIDACIGRLGRQNGRDQELVRIFVLQLSIGVRVLALELAE